MNRKLGQKLTPQFCLGWLYEKHLLASMFQNETFHAFDYFTRLDYSQLFGQESAEIFIQNGEFAEKFKLFLCEKKLV